MDRSSQQPKLTPDESVRPIRGVVEGCENEMLRFNVPNRRAVQFTFDGETINAYEGETIAVALLAPGQRTLRHTDRYGQPRGLFCNIGVCHECLVWIDGRSNQRACQFLVSDGIEVRKEHKQ